MRHLVACHIAAGKMVQLPAEPDRVQGTATSLRRSSRRTCLYRHAAEWDEFLQRLNCNFIEELSELLA